MLNGPYTAIIISAVFHLALLLILIYFNSTEKTLPEKKATKPAIKSYIYRPSKVVTKPEPKPDPAPKPEKSKSEPEQPQELTPKLIPKLTPELQTKPEKVLSEIKPAEPIKAKIAPKVLQKALVNDPIEEEQEQLTNAKPVPELPTATSQPKPRLSAREQLSRLRSTINNSVMHDAYKAHTQVRSGSVMHGEQIPVPHSNRQLTPEEEYKKNTVSTGHNAITKNDDGGCTIQRKQFIGSPVEATTSGFSCGESKFDKSFREHMKKVRDKVMPVRK